MVEDEESIFIENFEFNYMSERPLYRELPQWLLDYCDLTPDDTIVDLGCGSGIVTEHIVSRFKDAPKLKIYAVDPSEAELKIARSKLSSDDRIEFICARAQEISSRLHDVDAVVLCNVIHQIPLNERLDLFRSVFQILKEGGRFAFNTLFYDGAILPETRWFYIEWLKQCRLDLESRGFKAGLPSRKPPALDFLTAREHEQLLESAGFTDIKIEEPCFFWNVEDWEALSKYSVFIRGALSTNIGYKEGSDALISGVRNAYRNLKLDTVKRLWLHGGAKKT